MDDRRHRMVDDIISEASYRTIKEKILTALDDLKQQGHDKDSLIRFIDKSINQLNGMSWLQEDVDVKLKIRYSKSQLEIIKRNITEQSRYV